MQRTFIAVDGNVEGIAMADVVGTFQLDVGNVGAQARGGAVILAGADPGLCPFTAPGV